MAEHGEKLGIKLDLKLRIRSEDDVFKVLMLQNVSDFEKIKRRIREFILFWGERYYRVKVKRERDVYQSVTLLAFEKKAIDAWKNVRLPEELQKWFPDLEDSKDNDPAILTNFNSETLRELFENMGLDLIYIPSNKIFVNYSPEGSRRLNIVDKNERLSRFISSKSKLESKLRFKVLKELSEILSRLDIRIGPVRMEFEPNLVTF